MEATKGRFADITQNQIRDFLELILDFVKKYDEEGPGTTGEDLDSGYKLMEPFGEEIQYFEKSKLDLQAAELLFDQPLADYSEFTRIVQDYELLEILYKLYNEQKAAREVWSKTLWVNLNPQALVDGIEAFMKDFRRLPRIARTHIVGVEIDMKMKQFKSTVPLMVSLKNEAMRERHWKQLMDKTGINIKTERRTYYKVND